MKPPSIALYRHILEPDDRRLPHQLPLDDAHRCHSFVFNFLQLLFTQIQQTPLTLTDTSGTPRSVGPYTTNLDGRAAAGVYQQGVALGRGTLPNDVNLYTLEIPVTHGTGSSQLLYGLVSFDSPYIVGQYTYAALRRDVTNQSGASIALNEQALILGGGLPVYRYMVARDLIIPAFNIGNGITRQFVYTFTTLTS